MAGESVENFWTSSLSGKEVKVVIEEVDNFHIDSKYKYSSSKFHKKNQLAMGLI